MSTTERMTFRPNMSIFIPCVTNTTTEEQIKRVFKNLDLGIVSRVDFVEKDSTSKYFMAFVHFDYWLINNSSYHLQERILNYGQGKIVYNDPYYWIVMENQNPRTKAEIELENEVTTLKNRVKYLETVIANHTKKFIENGITTQLVSCPECWVTNPPDDLNDCSSCGYSNEEFVIYLPSNNNVNEGDKECNDMDPACLAMTGVLDSGLVKEGEAVLNVRTANSSENDTSDVQVSSGWWPWHY